MVGFGLEQTLGEVELTYFISERFCRRGFARKAVTAIAGWCFSVSPLPYLILTIDCANAPSCAVAAACGAVLFEKRFSIGHAQPNMESEGYYYYRLYRK